MKQPVDEAKMNQSLERTLADIGAAMSASLVVIGDKLGLYKTLAATGPMSPSELARATATNERYVREWLNNQAAGGYVSYNAAEHTFYLTPEQAALMADETSPYFMPGAFEIIAATSRDEPRIEQRFRTGGGLAWGEHDPVLYSGTERFFGPNYAAHLVQSWIPSLDGVESKLESGIEVADVGCGHGVSTVLMAKAYPNSHFTGYDYHEPSIRVAKTRAKMAGVDSRVRFQVGKAEELRGAFDFVTSFDCLHDMADPLGAARNTRQALRPDGTWMIVEPNASDDVSGNLNPVGRVFYAASTMLCVPCSLAGHGPALGAQAGEARIREVVTKGGFTHFRRASETPFNMVLEAKP
jgi:2-polyprenyl-3-methyl-5-hydroxy-6-metoxy-1,4-benzoquinol methylase